MLFVKLMWIAGGLILMWFISIGVSSAYQIDFFLALGMTLAFWCASIGLQIAMAVRLSRVSEGEKRFRIGTIMLLTSYLALYLAVWRLLLGTLLDRLTTIQIVNVILFVVCGTVLMSAFQLVFAEAVVTFLLKLFRAIRAQNRRRETP